MKNKRQKRKAHWKRNRVLFALTLFLFVSVKWIHSLNVFMEPRLHAVAKQNVIFAINNVTQSVLANLQYDPHTLIIIDKHANGTISSIQYDSYKLNQILYSTLATIDRSMNEEVSHKQLPIGQEVFFKDGVIYECPIGYLTKIPFLSTLGPTIPIRLDLLNDVSGEIKVDTQPYGINNTLIKAYIEINVKTQVMTVLSTTEMETKTQIPIIIQVVSGQVPQFSPYATQRESLAE